MADLSDPALELWIASKHLELLLADKLWVCRLNFAENPRQIGGAQRIRALKDLEHFTLVSPVSPQVPECLEQLRR